MLPWSTPPWHGTRRACCASRSIGSIAFGEARARNLRRRQPQDLRARLRRLQVRANGRGRRSAQHDETSRGMGRMSETAARSASAPTCSTRGRPMFGKAPLALFSEAGLAWDVVPVKGGVPPPAFTDYDALAHRRRRVSDASSPARTAGCASSRATASATTRSTSRRSTGAAFFSPIRRSRSGTPSPPPRSRSSWP